MSTANIVYQGNTVLSAEGNLNLNPSGSLTLKGHVAGVDLQEYSAKLQDIADASFTTNHILYWDGSNITGKVEVAAESTTVANPLTLTGSEVGLALDSGNLEVNGSNELAIKAGGVGSTELGADCVDASKLADDCVGSEHLQDGCVGNSALADDAVTTAKISTNIEINQFTVVNGTTHKSDQSYADTQHLALAGGTSNATTVQLSLFTMVNASAYNVDVKVTCKDQTNGDLACYSANFLAQRVSGGSSAIVSAENVVVIHEDNSNMGIGFSIFNTHDVALDLTGSANACQWSVFVTAVRVN